MKPQINRTDPGLEMEAEKILLGLILKSGSIPTDLSISHFTGQNKEVFKAIEKISKETIPDILNVSMMLKKENPDNSLIAYVTSLSSTEAVVSQIDYYMDMVIKNSNDRQIKELFEHGAVGKLSAEEVFSKASEINNSYKKPNQLNKIYTAQELAAAQYTENEWIADNCISTGLTIISGTQKIGKSWLALNLCVSVSSGGYFLGKIKANKTGVLYLALEDNNKRLTKRLNKVIQGDKELLNSIELNIANKFSGYVKALRDYLEQYKNIRLVIIDTLIKFVQSAEKDTVKDIRDYSQTTKALTALKDIADDLNIAIVVIHHARKGSNKATETDDPFDDTLGSTGLNATPDTTMMFKRKSRTEAEAELNITGRDIEDLNYILDFDRDLGSWSLKGDKKELQDSAARQEIYDYIKENPGQKPKEIHSGMKQEGATRTDGALKVLLGRMLKDNSLVNNKGHYSVNQYTEYTQYTVFTGEQAEKPIKNPEKQPDLDLQPEYNHEIAKDILSYIEKNQHANIDDETLTQAINGEYKDIIRAKNELIKGGYIFEMNGCYKYKQPDLAQGA